MKSSIRLAAGLSLRGTALDPAGLRAVQVRCGNPALVVSLGSRGNGGAIGSNDANLVGRVDGLVALGRGLGALATLAAALLLGEQSGDPGVVDEVAGAGENGGEDDVEEEAESR